MLAGHRRDSNLSFHLVSVPRSLALISALPPTPSNIILLSLPTVTTMEPVQRQGPQKTSLAMCKLIKCRQRRSVKRLNFQMKWCLGVIQSLGRTSVILRMATFLMFRLIPTTLTPMYSHRWPQLKKQSTRSSALNIEVPHYPNLKRPASLS
jgi:hypothetical protein